MGWKLRVLKKGAPDGRVEGARDGMENEVKELMEQQELFQMDELRVLELGWKLRVLKLMEEQMEH